MAMLAGCQSEVGQKAQAAIGTPGATTLVKIHSAVERGDYVDVLIEGHNTPPRLFFRSEDPCRDILVEGGAVEYVMSGSWGRLRKEAVSCDPAGIGEPSYWRNRKSHGFGRKNPTAPARYTMVYQDEGVAFLRGDFPLTGRIGWPSYGDTIAVIGRGGFCEQLVDQTITTMESRGIGPDALVLMTREGNCPIIGLIAPRGRP
jgi:hypothetical protein